MRGQRAAAISIKLYAIIIAAYYARRDICDISVARKFAVIILVAIIDRIEVFLRTKLALITAERGLITNGNK